MSQHPFIDFPVGEKPGWEFEHGQGEELKSVPESLTIYQSLRQSRDRWVHSTFPKFSSKARGKAATDAPPPHTLQFRAKFELEIGPHIFPDTLLYEVHYLQSQPTSGSTAQNQPSSQQALNTWRSTPYIHYSPHAQTVAAASSSTSSPTQNGQSSTPTPSSSMPPRPVSTPVITPLTAVTSITPTLISKVNTAAATNPTLAHLLQLAAAGHATPDQLKTLGLLIQSLSDAAIEPTLPEPTPTFTAPRPLTPSIVSNNPTSTRPSQPPTVPVKGFDLVLEFQHLPTERWLFPRGPVVCHKFAGGFPTDIFLTLRIPLGSDEALAEKLDSPPSQSVVFCLKTVPLAVWDTLVKWIGGEEKKVTNQTALDRLPRQDDVFISHQIAEGTLLTQLQARSTGYAMKSIKPGIYAGQRAKRKSVPKKASVQQATQDNGGAHVAKKARSNVSTPIQCETCKQQDVPLIQNGRFCRPCAEREAKPTNLPMASQQATLPDTVENQQGSSQSA